MFMPPNNQIHPLRDILRVEGLMQWRTSSKPFLVSILMEYEYLHIIAEIPLRRLELHFLLLKQLVQNQIFDVPQPIEGDLTGAPSLRNNQGTNDDLMQIGIFTKVIHIVASLQ
jgi:hypothetical protein